ncbi:MAG: sugar phosphate nucleotidyltransferase, partial [Gemmatimonadota bacterium]
MGRTTSSRSRSVPGSSFLEFRRSSLSADPHLWVLVLAGGMGSRFWPLSTPVRPKQLLPLVGERPLIAHALERARALAPEDHVRILTGAHLVGAIQETLPEVSEVDYMVEPVQKGTCPPLVWAARDVARLDPDAVLVSLHADHVIWPLDAFR